MSIVSFINRPQILNLLDTPKIQRHAFTTLIVSNAVLRPLATLSDKSASSKERHYSATRELLQQAMCLICHLTLAPTFERFAFKAARQFPQLQKEFEKFEIFQQVQAARQFNVAVRRNNRLVAAGLKKGILQNYQEIPKVLTGVLRIGDSIGTIAALACFAPLVNNYILGPALKAFTVNQERKNTVSTPSVTVTNYTALKNPYLQPNIFHSIPSSAP